MVCLKPNVQEDPAGPFYAGHLLFQLHPPQEAAVLNTQTNTHQGALPATCFNIETDMPWLPASRVVENHLTGCIWITPPSL